MAGRHFDRVFLRGDSKFHQHAIIAECERYGATFAFVMDGCAAIPAELAHQRSTMHPRSLILGSAWAAYHVNTSSVPPLATTVATVGLLGSSSTICAPYESIRPEVDPGAGGPGPPGLSPSGAAFKGLQGNNDQRGRLRPE